MKKAIIAACAVGLIAALLLSRSRPAPERRARTGDPTRPEDHMKDATSTPDSGAGPDAAVPADRSSGPDSKAGPDANPDKGGVKKP